MAGYLHNVHVILAYEQVHTVKWDPNCLTMLVYFWKKKEYKFSV